MGHPKIKPINFSLKLSPEREAIAADRTAEIMRLAQALCVSPVSISQAEKIGQHAAAMHTSNERIMFGASGQDMSCSNLPFCFWSMYYCEPDGPKNMRASSFEHVREIASRLDSKHISDASNKGS